MQMIYRLVFTVSLIALGILGCGTIAPTPPVIEISDSKVIFQGETPNQTEVQNIELDNCEGKGDLAREEQRSQSVEVSMSTEIAAQLGASIEIISAEVQATVQSTNSNGAGRTTAIQLVAPPNTHMVFQIEWLGTEQMGVIQNLRGSNTPIAFQSFLPTDVRIKSQADIGCGDSPPVALLPSEPLIPATPTRFVENRLCPLIVIEGSVNGLPITQTQTWSELTQQGTTNEPQSSELSELCSRDGDNLVQVWVGYWSGDRSYLDFRRTMTVEQAVALVNQNPNQPIIIVPWGE